MIREGEMENDEKEIRDKKTGGTLRGDEGFDY